MKPNDTAAGVHLTVPTVVGYIPLTRKVSMKRGRGRPPVYNGNDRRRVATALRKYGLTKGLVFLKEHGLTVSATLALSVAAEKGITFSRGRPKLKAA